MRLGSDDVHRELKQTLFRMFCYSLYIIFFVILAVKLWMKIK